MILISSWLFILLGPIHVQSQVVLLGGGSHDYDITRNEAVKQELGTTFQDVLSLERICTEFFEDQGFNICEMESGWSQRNPNGRFLVEGNHTTMNQSNQSGWSQKNPSGRLLVEGEPSHNESGWGHKNPSGRLLVEESRKDLDEPSHALVVLKEDIHEWRDPMLNLRSTNLKKKRNLATCQILNHPYHGNQYSPGMLFSNTIRFFVADPEIVSVEALTPAIEALDHFNHCTENMKNFEVETHFIDVNVMTTNWMLATYIALEQARTDGISDDMRQFMTVIILPDNVDFREYYGFATLHYGLTVLKSSAMADKRHVLHEIGHNLGMKHSSTINDGEYGDERCIMGNPTRELACFNGPKSYYLGLYMDHTAVIAKEMNCNVIVTMADTDDHLFDSIAIQNAHGTYYVVVEVEIPTATNLYMMYYKTENVVAVTSGSFGSIEGNEGDKLQFSDVSQHEFDLGENSSNTYGQVFIKRCTSSSADVAKVLVSFDLNAANECY